MIYVVWKITLNTLDEHELYKVEDVDVLLPQMSCERKCCINRVCHVLGTPIWKYWLGLKSFTQSYRRLHLSILSDKEVVVLLLLEVIDVSFCFD